MTHMGVSVDAEPSSLQHARDACGCAGNIQGGCPEPNDRCVLRMVLASPPDAECRQILSGWQAASAWLREQRLTSGRRFDAMESREAVKDAAHRMEGVADRKEAAGRRSDAAAQMAARGWQMAARWMCRHGDAHAGKWSGMTPLQALDDAADLLDSAIAPAV